MFVLEAAEGLLASFLHRCAMFQSEDNPCARQEQPWQKNTCTHKGAARSGLDVALQTLPSQRGTTRDMNRVKGVCSRRHRADTLGVGLTSGEVDVGEEDDVRGDEGNELSDANLLFEVDVNHVVISQAAVG